MTNNFWNEIMELEKEAERTQAEIQHKIEKRSKGKKKGIEVIW